MIQYILASASPRRRELLGQLGITYEVIPAQGEEIITNTEPQKVVEELSYQKAYAVLKLQKPTEQKYVVIGADTVVSIDGKILGKPKDELDAIKMLQKLSGNSHEVYTGVTVLEMVNDEVKAETFHECTKVFFDEMSDQEIKDYVKTKEPMDKAGGYGIQGLGAKFIKGVEGDFFNVVGLPLHRLYEVLKNKNLI